MTRMHGIVGMTVVGLSIVTTSSNHTAMAIENSYLW
jgi:hypothetical protein